MLPTHMYICTLQDLQHFLVHLRESQHAQDLVAPLHSRCLSATWSSCKATCCLQQHFMLQQRLCEHLFEILAWCLAERGFGLHGIVTGDCVQFSASQASLNNSSGRTVAVYGQTLHYAHRDSLHVVQCGRPLFMVHDNPAMVYWG